MSPHRVFPLLVAAVLALGTAALAFQRVRLAPSFAEPITLKAWELQRPSSWAIRDGTLVLKTAGKPSGPIRKPAEWAILRSEPFGDVTLTAQVRSDAPTSLKGRDVLLFFGYQSPTRFYYVHLSNETTATHNGIFLVDDADRKRLDGRNGKPMLNDQEWHRVRLVRKVEDGAIEVYFDDSAEPALSAKDKTILSGRVGVGSFDDEAAFKDIVVEGTKAQP